MAEFMLLMCFNSHCCRKKPDNTYQGTTWQIKFVLDTVNQNGTYKLRVAIASASLAELQVKMNEDDGLGVVLCETEVICFVGSSEQSKCE